MTMILQWGKREVWLDFRQVAVSFPIKVDKIGAVCTLTYTFSDRKLPLFGGTAVKKI